VASAPPCGTRASATPANSSVAHSLSSSRGFAPSAANGNPDVRRCPSHGTMLWPKAKVRKIRFHDLRHTTASLLMMAGANPAAVQRILRHRDPRITTETYGHLAPEYLRAEGDRLRFNVGG
jgi:integrase